MVTKDEMIAIARMIAAAHKLPPEIVCGQIQRESDWEPYAMRYEPAFLSKYVAPLYTAGKITATEAYTRSMSWGLGQVLGQVARELGFTRTYFGELSDPSVGIEYQCRKLDKCLVRAGGDMSKALEMYNGGSNLNYAQEVIEFSKEYVAPPSGVVIISA